MGSRWPVVRLFLCLLSLFAAAALADETDDEKPKDPWLNVTPPYRSEPSIVPEIVEVKNLTSDRSKLYPGYLFFAPTSFTHGSGPKIYDIDNKLIWDGKSSSPGIAHQFHACNVDGKIGEHLCWHDSSHLGAVRKGKPLSDLHDFQRVFDNTYRQYGWDFTTTGDIYSSTPIANFTKMGAVKSPVDSHEFHMVGDGTSYVQVVYYRKEADLSAWKSLDEGWILESCFQEVRLRDEAIIFSWCYLDHLPLETNIYVGGPNQTNFTTGLAGDGTWFGAWDFYHINSVDKNEEGDYLISGRHADQVMKIAGNNSPNGKPGTALWRLGGPSNQFEKEGNWTFERQHDARFVGTSAEWTFFTLFDNAWEGEAPENSTHQPYSSAQLIAVNNVTMKAKLIQNYPHPGGQLARSGGSVQMLPNKNIFVGWGFIREVSEFTYEGELLFHAHLKSEDGAGVINYRNYKYAWVGQPAASPKLVAYSLLCSDEWPTPLTVYVSWNGATEVVSWRFFVYDSQNLKGPWVKVGTFASTGFETKARIADKYYAHVYAEALDREGNVLATTSRETFVPNKEALQGCDGSGCFAEALLDYDPRFASTSCGVYHHTSSIAIIFLIVCVEFASWVYSTVMCRIAGRIAFADSLGLYSRLDGPDSSGDASTYAIADDAAAMDEDREKHAGR